MVVSNCIPGSPQACAASAIIRSSSRAWYGLGDFAVDLTKCVCHSPSSTTACMNSSVARTELLAFWKNTEP